MAKGCYPLFVALQDKACLVVGGGRVAERKIRSLLDHGAQVRLVARERTASLAALCDKGTVIDLGRDYHASALEDVVLVFAATSDDQVNRRVAADARERHIWCNLASSPQEGSFFVPAAFQRGALTIAVSTAGVSPALAAGIRDQLAVQFGPQWELYLKLMGALRRAVHSKDLGSDPNQAMLRRVAQLPLLAWLERGARDEALQALHAACQPWLGYVEIAAIWDESCKPSA
jgi:precorrin-2 dehydrogenase/sirohydrochlorin ferrochelatase